MNYNNPYYKNNREPVDNYCPQYHECDSYKHTIKDPNKDINVNINLIGSKSCTTSSCPTPSCHSNVTLTSGPFHVPIFADLQAPGIQNDRLIITLKNPTNRPLSASLQVTVCQLPSPAPTPTPGTPILFNFNTAETAIAGFPLTVNVPAISCNRIEIPITSYQRATLRITSTGPYAICDTEQACGGLEISIAGGVGAATGGIADPGLNYADPSLTFRFEEFVLCDTL